MTTGAQSSDPRSAQELSSEESLEAASSVEQDRAVYELLAEVIDLSPKARAEALSSADAGLAQRVRSLLVETVGGETGWTSPHSSLEEESVPEQIGPYRILEPLGEGGMGRVYLALQEEPVRRRVAIKVLRVSLESGEARARFEAERHAMGRLDHPNIGRLLDAGSTADDLPYFAMELIDGSPITEYADAGALDIKARIRLMVDVCRAVDHAHRKFLLHRDIKPSNVLVAELDRPTPKLIDFGIAKGLDHKLVDVTLATGSRLLGTPEYMSPEALGLGGELDTRSDVFSLGVLLYELVSGVRPWSLSGAAPMERLRNRMQHLARRPSTQISRVDGETQAELARQRGLGPSEHRARLRGDLDRIVMMAMATNPGRRYSSAADLGTDLERFLRDEPVSARRPTNAYLLRKLIRRNRPVFLASLVAAVSLVLGIAGTGVALVQARQAEGQARLEAAAAAAARDESDEVVRFMVGAFRSSAVNGPGQSTPPAERSARDILDSGAAEVDLELSDRPLIQARLKSTIGTVYRELGLFEQAQTQAEEAEAIYRRVADHDPLARLENLYNLVNLDLRRGRLEQVEERMQGLEAALATMEQEEVSPRVAIQRTNVKLQAGRIERDRGRFESAERLLRESIEEFRRIAPEHQNLRIAVNTLALTYFRQQRWREAEIEFRESLRMHEAVLEPGHATLARAADNLGAAIASQGRLDEAAPLFERSLAEKRLVLGERHPSVAESLNNIGRLRFDLGDWEEAQRLHRQALAIREEVLGPEHRSTAWSLDNLARALAATGDFDGAKDLQLRALAIRESLPGRPALNSSLEHLAQLHRDQGQLADARDVMLRLLDLQTADSPADSNIDPELLKHLGEIEQQLGDEESARRRFELASRLESSSLLGQGRR